jgi:hypothetical protein
MKRLVLIGAILSVMSASAMAGLITYVDAELGNTKIGGADPALTTNYVSSGSSTSLSSDNKWGWRTLSGGQNGAGVWESDAASFAGDRESTPDISVDMVLPAAGVYDLYALFYINGFNASTSVFSGRWDIACRVGATGDFTQYNRTNYPGVVTLAQADEFATLITINTGSNRHVKAYLGQYIASAPNTTVTIYVNGFDSWNGVSGDHRTVFDGVGYALVPEPATMVLLAAGMVMFKRKR